MKDDRERIRGNELKSGRRGEGGAMNQRMEELLGELRPIDPPPFYTERLLARVRMESAGRPWSERLRSPGLAWAVAGACVVALVLIVAGMDQDLPAPLPVAPLVDVADSGIDPVTPAGDSVVGAGDVEIVAAIHPPLKNGIVRLYVDETDVTGLAEITESYVIYSPPERLREGEHIVTIEVVDGSGRRMRDVSWLFYALNGEHDGPDERI